MNWVGDVSPLQRGLGIGLQVSLMLAIIMAGALMLTGVNYYKESWCIPVILAVLWTTFVWEF
jgi:uncharacterized membrane protein